MLGVGGPGVVGREGSFASLLIDAFQSNEARNDSLLGRLTEIIDFGKVELTREIAALGTEEADLELQTKMSRDKAAAELAARGDAPEPNPDADAEPAEVAAKVVVIAEVAPMDAAEAAPGSPSKSEPGSPSKSRPVTPRGRALVRQPTVQELTSVAGKRYAAQQKKPPPVAIETGASLGGPDDPGRIAAFMFEESGLKKGVSSVSMMSQDPGSLEEMLVALERPLRVLGGLSAAPVAEQVKELRRAGRFVLPPHPSKSGLGALEPALGSIHATVDALRRYSSLLIDIEDEGGEGEDEGEDEGEVEEAKVEVKRASPPGRPTLLTPYPNLEPNPHHSPLTTQRSLLPQKTCSLLQKTLTTEDLQLATDGLQPYT